MWYRRNALSIVVAALVGLYCAGSAAMAAGDEAAGAGHGHSQDANAQADAGGDHSGGHAEPSSPFAGTFINALVTLVIFLLVLIVLGKWAWGPILSALQRREDFIRDSLADAKKDREAAEVRLQEYTEQLNRARAEATAIVEEGRRDAEVVRQRIQSEARADAEAMTERAKREIGLARDGAIKELYERTAEMATVVAGRVLRRQLTSEEHDRMLSESLDELNRLGPNGTK